MSLFGTHVSCSRWNARTFADASSGTDQVRFVRWRACRSKPLGPLTRQCAPVVSIAYTPGVPSVPLAESALMR